MEIYGQQLVAHPNQGQGLKLSQHANQQKQAKELPDRACLAFSIDLLDYILKGDLFESTLVGFPAVFGIDFRHQTFHIAKRPISQGFRK